MIKTNFIKLYEELSALTDREQKAGSAIKLNEELSTEISRKDNHNDISPFGYKVDFYDGDAHIGEASVCGVKDDNAFLYDFMVYPEFRGKGYSKPMLQFMLDKYNIRQLYVLQDNDIAINLYRKYGFIIVAEANNGTEFLMER